MNKGVVILVAGMLVVTSFTAGRWSASERRVTLSLPQSEPIERYDVVEEPPAYSEKEASDLRASHYTDLDDIEGVLDLPTDFAQTEALYAIAGRVDRRGLEELIEQSMKITNRYDRRAALSILYGRYTELDPEAAVEHLVSVKLDIDDQMFSSIFDAWAKVDLNAAVSGANRIGNSRQRRSAQHALLTSVARTNPALLERVAADLSGQHDLSRYRSEVVGLRANTQPQLALAEALAMSDRQGRWSAIYRVARVWARNDPVQALDALELIDDISMKSQFSEQVLQRWVADDPEAAMQYISSYPEGEMRDQLMQQGLARYALEAPEDAMNLAMQLTGHNRQQSITKVALAWAAEDPVAALDSILAMDNAAQRSQLISGVGQQLAMRNPDRALDWIGQLDPSTHAEHLTSVLTTVAQSDPRRALDHVMNTQTGNARSTMLLRVLQRASTGDATLVLDYIDQLPNSEEANQLYSRIASHMAIQDADGAMQWISGLTGAAKTQAISGAVHSIARKDPAQASRLIAQMPPGQAGRAILDVSANLSHRDPDAALAWVEQYRGTDSYDGAVQQVVRTITRTDPQRALRMAAAMNENARIETSSMAVAAWAMNSPSDAARWASAADATIRDRVVASVASVWGRSDPARASRWALGLPTGAARDDALVALSGLVSADVRDVSGIVSSISSDNSRRQAIQVAYNRIMSGQGGRSEADRFLDQVDASEDLRQQLQRYPGR